MILTFTYLVTVKILYKYISRWISTPEINTKTINQNCCAQIKK